MIYNINYALEGSADRFSRFSLLRFDDTNNYCKSSTMVRIIVTGGSGYVGQNIIRSFLESKNSEKDR